MVEAELRDRRREAYESPRPAVDALVPAEARRILDLGCSSGALGAALKASRGAEVVGIELLEEYAADAARVLDRVLCGDVGTVLAETGDLGSFDCIVAADVLEHLVDPWAVLAQAVALLEPGGVVVVSLPNVRYAKTVLELVVRGRWPRDDAGLFDRTHLRWFTPADARTMLEDAGLAIDAEHPQYWFYGRALTLARTLGRAGLAPFLAGQYVFRGRLPA
jgi:2-polyprenyl-3-methyl-5-hydroxy-6-metoxy-1,4-benzoquinol methylase